MKPLRLLFPLALFALSAACSTERPSRDEYLGVVRQIVRFAARDAREAAPQGSADGPLLVDASSFGFGAGRVTGEEIAPDTVLAALEEPVRQSTFEEAVLCEDAGLGAACYVREDGVFVRLGLARRTSSTIRVLVVSTSTHGNRFPSAICERRHELLFEQRGGEWTLAEAEPTRVC